MARRLALLAAILVLAVALAPADARRGARAPGSSIVELGRRLFLDPAVSAGGETSCAACHDPAHGFSDPRTFSVDENGPTARHSQPLLDMRDGTGFHWDGEFDDLRQLLVARLAPPSDALEQAGALHRRHFERSSRSRAEPDESEFARRMQALAPPYYGPRVETRVLPAPLVRRLDEEGRYASGFLRTFGSSTVTTERILSAMEAYLFSLRSGENAYDRFAKGDRTALSPAARRGLELFKGKANCAECHSMGRHGRAEFTDRRYRNTGVAFVGRQVDELAFAQEGGPGGRGVMSFVAGDLGKFKTPSLRDVARRPPYMHDGSLRTLEEVVRYYDKGGTANPGLDHALKPLDLDDREVADLVAFLEALTSDERPGLGPVPRHRPSRTRVRVVSLAGEPMADLRLHVVPFGDRLGDADAPATPLSCTTDDRGWAEFAFPDWTHVRVLARGVELNEGQVLPDYTRKAVLRATPMDKASVRILAPVGVARMPELLSVRTRRGGPEVAVLAKVASLGRREAIYVARPGHPKEELTVVFEWTPDGSDGGPRRLDLTGGASGLIDLATPPGAVRFPGIVAGLRAADPAVRPTPAEERIGAGKMTTKMVDSSNSRPAR